ncbi:uncharacterized protein BCR38DRAFT_450524 [Pseudomassariella vexata]|uniref:Knr4/Smi1-like domain-containing protein n=1 Tax=Pseudomassariella vexata TaxID=1141098 RepID=A0A1Y2DCK8_9PEZI|nr:uncharacterized protein BCR38DRAFT_450524 [Pseudomassariella vexata]ORY56988.1 hypothetical protein BCR38DRAFT_450524 [Pseudomassariella vexata]
MTSTNNRPLQNQSVSELVHLFNNKCIEKKKLGSYGASTKFRDNPDDDYWRMPDTFLKDPAPRDEIDDLDRRAREPPFNFANGLPPDYLEFLRTTNGIYAIDRADDGDEIFRPAHLVELMDEEDWNCELLPKEMLEDCDVEIDWPELNGLIHIGAGGDEGYHWLVSPHTTKAAIAAFDDAYDKASDADKEKLEKAANELYSGLTEMRRLEYSVFRVYHWAAQIEAFASFKHLLEDFVTGMDEIKEEDDDEDEEGTENDDSDESADKET